MTTAGGLSFVMVWERWVEVGRVSVCVGSGSVVLVRGGSGGDVWGSMGERGGAVCVSSVVMGLVSLVVGILGCGVLGIGSDVVGWEGRFVLSWVVWFVCRL